MAQQARQVYYVPYPISERGRVVPWRVVIKTKPRGKVEIDNVIQLPYQSDAPQQVEIVPPDDETMPILLHDDRGGFEEVEVEVGTSYRVQRAEDEVEYASSDESTEEPNLSDAQLDTDDDEEEEPELDDDDDDDEEGEEEEEDEEEQDDDIDD